MPRRVAGLQPIVPLTGLPETPSTTYTPAAMNLKTITSRVQRNAATVVARLRHARKARLYCLGTAKSGTHSISAMFDSSVRTQHEADASRVLKRILAFSSGRMTEAELRRYVLRRDKWLYLDVDTSQLNFWLLDILLSEFPESRYVLTIRDCYSYVDSFINDFLRGKESKDWVALRDLHFRASVFTHPPEERLLKEKGLHTLDGYFSYWAEHNQKAIDTVPADRLLVVRTDAISPRAMEIADFAGLPRETVLVEESHAFSLPRKHGLLREINREYLEAKVQQYCAPLMRKYFPEIRSLDDANVAR